MNIRYLVFLLLFVGACSHGPSSEPGLITEAQYQHQELKLFVAANTGELGVVIDLVDNYGFSVNTEHRGNGGTPLHWAAESGQLAVVKYLTKKGANINHRDWSGETPFYRAVKYNQLAVVEFLLKKKVNPNIMTVSGSAPLHVAVNMKYFKVASAIVQLSNADVDISDKAFGSTPLHIAITNQDVQMARMLIRYGANRSTKNRRGDNALDICYMNFSRKMINVLNSRIKVLPARTPPKKKKKG